MNVEDEAQQWPRRVENLFIDILLEDQKKGNMQKCVFEKKTIGQNLLRC